MALLSTKPKHSCNIIATDIILHKEYIFYVPYNAEPGRGLEDIGTIDVALTSCVATPSDAGVPLSAAACAASLGPESAAVLRSL